MRTTSRVRRIGTWTLALVALFAFAGSAHAVLIVSFDPAPPSSVSRGESLLVNIVVSDLGGEVVSGFDVDILFNISVLRVDLVFVTTELGDFNLGEASVTGGLLSVGLNVAAVSFLGDADLLALQDGESIRLFSVEFDAIDDGTTDFAFGSVEVVSSAPIPEPTSVVLFGIGALVVGATLRKRAAA